MSTRLKSRDIGVWTALVSAVLFGAGTPLAKALLDGQSGSISPLLLAGLLYAGSGLGLLIYRGFKQLPSPSLNGNEKLWLLAAVLCGGAIAPVLLMVGLSKLAASHASLLLNAEAVLTTLLAWALFKEHLGQRIVWGMALIVAGALLLSWPSGGLATTTAASVGMVWPALAVVLACAFWALDNNFTRKVAHADASWIACVKGLTAGLTNLLLAFFVGASLPSLAGVSAAMTVGFFAYGVSLCLFVVALRHLGASRAGAYFSVAPFVGAALSVALFGETVTWHMLAASLLMGAGVWLHLTEHHTHLHAHAAHSHTHLHTHHDDVHHLHGHDASVDPLKPHSHTHHHEAMSHTHAHYPDAHHRHGH